MATVSPLAFFHSHVICNGGPCGGIHFFAASEYLIGSPGSSPIISNARCRCDAFAFDRKTVPTGNLLVSILKLYGIDVEKQGDSTGPLPKFA